MDVDAGAVDVSSAIDNDKQYEWLDPIEHVLRRPDMYAGSIQPRSVERTVLLPDGTVKTIKEELSPATEKIFDEVIVNAMDHRIRDSGMTRIDVEIRSDGEIFVSNNGSVTIPTGNWEGTSVPIPEVLFHKQHTGSNMNDDKKKAVGGRNGMGAKVTNYMSSYFEIQIGDAAKGETYVQRFENNGKVVHSPKRHRFKEKKCKTGFLFLPDYARLNVDLPLRPGVLELLIGRAVDATACTTAQVYINGVKPAWSDKGGASKQPWAKLRQYALAFGGGIIGADSTTEDSHDVGVQIVVTDKCDPPVHVCFVNGVRCTGTLLDACLKRVASTVLEKSELPTAVALGIVSEHVSVFVAGRIVDTVFGSQSKDVLTTPVSKFGFDVPTCSTISKNVHKIEALQKQLAQRQGKNEDKSVTKLLKSNSKWGMQVAKHDRATKLGVKNAKCTLWIAEGDSAKQMITSGFSVIGRDFNGVFPLRGKVLNVYDVSASVAVKSATILDLLTILDLDPNKTYDEASVKKLPYYRIMVVTDQDSDGSHIFGLVYAVFERFFPSLIRVCPQFINRFVTPVIRVRTEASMPVDFFSVSEFKIWKESEASKHRVRAIDYYKGLGTSTDAEACGYFGNLPKHMVSIQHNGASSTDLISIFFSKERIHDRRARLRSIDSTTYVDYSVSRVSIDDFCERELVHFSRYSLERAIPKMVDGLKPSQRKILWFSLQHPGKIKVEQLAGEVAKDMNYHHGASSLEGAIVCLAQSFIGTNNINLLVPSGQYGNRHGEKAAQPRYLNTLLAPVTRQIFRREDDLMLTLLNDEGRDIEPECLYPIIPMVLVNGANGIGTGWSTSVLTYNPADVIQLCLIVAENGTESSLPKLLPWHRGWKGDVELEPDGQHVLFKGKYRVSPPNSKGFVTISVEELPPSAKTNDVKAAYHAIDGVVDVVPHFTKDSVDMDVVFQESAVPSDIPKKLKLIERVSLSNMNLFDEQNVLTHYDSAEDILRAFANLRLRAYGERIRCQLYDLREHLALCQLRLDLLMGVSRGEIILHGKRKADLADEIGVDKAKILFDMGIAALMLDDIEERRKEIETIESKIRRLEKTTPAKEWTQDLMSLASHLGIKPHKRMIEKES